MHTPVVGQQQQPGGILVQPSHGKYPLRKVYEVEYDFLAGMAAAGDIPPWFIQGDIDFFIAERNRFAPDGHGVYMRVYLAAQFRYLDTVYVHLTGLDILFTFAAGAYPGGRQKFL